MLKYISQIHKLNKMNEELNGISFQEDSNAYNEN